MIFRKSTNQFRWLSGYVALLACLSLLGCSGYPEVTSAESQDLIARLYTACNTSNQDRLERVKQKLQELIREEKITEREQEKFLQIIELANEGNFEQAAEQAMRFAESQRRR